AASQGPAAHAAPQGPAAPARPQGDGTAPLSGAAHHYGRPIPPPQDSATDRYYGPSFDSDRASPTFGADPTRPDGQNSGVPQQTSGAGHHLDPYGREPDPWDSPFPPIRPGPRIEPSPPSHRGRLLVGALAGLAGLIIFGTGGFFVGRQTATAAPAVTRTASGPAAGALPLYERSQLALNQPKIPPSLTAVSQGWLPYLTGCSRNGEPGGPVPNDGEKARVRCSLGGMSVIFVEYSSVSDRDKARAKVLGQNVDARTLTPGVKPVADAVAAPSTRTNGSYVEYAYQVTEGTAVRTVAAIRWDDAQTPVAGYLLAYWTDSLASDWAPVRDLWGRYA
ncbi:MAG: hypothetical protein QOH97_3552, partial [Actinoplanes sp.]|nr:hypothetical protein [Actinoplanes sp.]